MWRNNGDIMKRFIQLTLASLVALIGISLASPLVAPADAINVFDKACNGGSGGTGTNNSGGGGLGNTAGQNNSGGGDSSSICGAAKQDDAQDIIKNVINTILVVLGMIAVIMIIIGGIRYTTSNGDPGSIKSAKDTILYAVVGLVIAILSFAIVNFVLGRFS